MTIKFHRSKYTPGRLIADNGADIMAANRLSAAIDKNEYGEYTLRIWAKRADAEVVDGVRRLGDAKRVVAAVLAASLDEGDRELHWWVRNEYHRIHMATMAEIWAEEDAAFAAR